MDRFRIATWGLKPTSEVERGSKATFGYWDRAILQVAFLRIEMFLEKHFKNFVLLGKHLRNSILLTKHYIQKIEVKE